MKFNELQVLLGNITYKPTFHIAAYAEPHIDYITIRIGIVAPDATQHPIDPYNLSPVVSTQTIPRHYLENMTVEHILHEIRRQIIKLELHEVDEFFKFNGECFVDPHPEDNR